MRTDDKRSPGRPHGWVSLYALAFGLVIASGVFVVIAARDFLATLTSLWISIALSATAIVIAALAVALPPRR